MRFTLEIEPGNDAMQQGDQIAEALRTVAFRLDQEVTEGNVRDDNGNTCGSWAIA